MGAMLTWVGWSRQESLNMRKPGNQDFSNLVQRFDAGDRSSELLHLLNQAAFDCFHAPWEQVERLPSLESRADFKEEGDPAPLNPGRRQKTESPMDSLSVSLETIGLQAHRCRDASLTVTLPYDPTADCQGHLLFTADPARRLFDMVCQGDVGWVRGHRTPLEAACRAYSQQKPGVEARVIYLSEFANLRVQWTASLPYGKTDSCRHLELLLQKNLQFWRYLKCNGPTS